MNEEMLKKVVALEKAIRQLTRHLSAHIEQSEYQHHHMIRNK